MSLSSFPDTDSAVLEERAAFLLEESEMEVSYLAASFSDCLGKVQALSLDINHFLSSWDLDSDLVGEGKVVALAPLLVSFFRLVRELRDRHRGLVSLGESFVSSLFLKGDVHVAYVTFDDVMLALVAVGRVAAALVSLSGQVKAVCFDAEDLSWSVSFG